MDRGAVDLWGMSHWAMKFNPEYFDMIRVKPRRERNSGRSQAPKCAHEGCREPGTHPAPKGRDEEGEYFYLCLEHVRDYNRSYNYFSGMGSRDVEDYLEKSRTGHRPTWHMGTQRSPRGADDRPDDKDDSLHRRARHRSEETSGQERSRSAKHRVVRNTERKLLAVLGLEVDATAEEIKIRYKQLVKIYHPDVNGADREAEDKLREVIQAYDSLKTLGMC